jgi:uncharacterized protein YukE
MLCNAAKSDRSRLHGLEVEVAQLSHRAEKAEATSTQLQQRLQHLKVHTTSCQDFWGEGWGAGKNA